MAAFMFKNSKQSYKYEPLRENEEVELTSPILPQYDQVVERPVRTGETLRTVALNYRISVSELKRINRLQNDSEFYALSHIKIPVKANSLLSEILKEEAEAYASSSQPAQNCGSSDSLPHRARLSSCTTNDTEDSDPDTCVGYISIQQILREKSTRKEARRFLKNMQEDLARIKEKVVSDKASLSEAAAALTDPRFVPIQDQRPGWERGLSWWRLLLAAVVVLVLLPIIYLVYMLKYESGKN